MVSPYCYHTINHQKVKHLMASPAGWTGPARV
jgi:hypothetical protein